MRKPEEETWISIVRRHPEGGYAIVHTYIEADGSTPDVDADLHPKHMTLHHAVREAAEGGLYYVDPECYRAPTRLIKGI